MKKRIILIEFNTILIVMLFSQLYEEYKQKGKFQWTDPDRIADDEETYLTPFFVAVIVFGLVAICYELLKFQKHPFMRLINKMLNLLSSIYGLILFFSSLTLIVVLLMKWNNETNTSLKILVLISLLFTVSLGGYTLYNNLTEENNDETP